MIRPTRKYHPLSPSRRYSMGQNTDRSNPKGRHPRFNIFDKNEKFIASGKFLNPKVMNIFDINDNFISIGRFLNNTQFNVFDTDGNYIGYGKMIDLKHFNIFDTSGNYISQGSIQ